MRNRMATPFSLWLLPAQSTRLSLRQAQLQFYQRHHANRGTNPRSQCHGGEPSVPAKTVPEFIAYAKVEGSKINMASPGVGTSVHLSGELFKMMAGINMLHVPYRGAAPAQTDLLSGQVQVMFGTMPGSIKFIRTNKARALAVTSATRSEELPEVPTVAEFVPGYEASTWYGIGAPKNTATEIINRLNKEINAALADPKFKVQLTDWGAQ